MKNTFFVISRNIKSLEIIDVKSFDTKSEAQAELERLYLKIHNREMPESPYTGKSYTVINGNVWYYLSSLEEQLYRKDKFEQELALKTLEGFGNVIQTSSVPELNWVYTAADDNLLDAFDEPAHHYLELCKNNPDYTCKYYTSDSYFIEDEDVDYFKEVAVKVSESDIRDGSFELFYKGELLLTLRSNNNPVGKFIYDWEKSSELKQFDKFVSTNK